MKKKSLENWNTYKIYAEVDGIDKQRDRKGMQSFVHPISRA